MIRGGVGAGDFLLVSLILVKSSVTIVLSENTMFFFEVTRFYKSSEITWTYPESNGMFNPAICSV